MWYLLKYVMQLLFWPKKSTVFSIYAVILLKSMGICFSLDLRASSANIYNFDRGSITQAFCDIHVQIFLFVLIFQDFMDKIVKFFLTGPDYLAPDFPLIFALLDLPPSHKFQNMYWHIRPCQWIDCIWTYLTQILLGIIYPASPLHFLSLKTLKKKIAMMNKMKKMNACDACISFFEIYVFWEKEKNFLSTRMKKYFYSKDHSLSTCFWMIFFFVFCFFVLGSTSPIFPFFRDSFRWVSCDIFHLIFVGSHEGRASNSIFKMDLFLLPIFF